MFRGGRASEGDVEAQIPADYDPLNPGGKYRPSSMTIPSYFYNPFGASAAEAAAAAASDQLGLTDPSGNRQYTLRDVVNTQQIYTPRADSPAITLGSRGFEDAPVIDYNQRLLGDPTRTYTTQERIDNPDYNPNASGNTSGTTTGGGTTGGGTTGGGTTGGGTTGGTTGGGAGGGGSTTGSGTQVKTGTTQIVTGGSPYNETFGMGEGVVSDLTTGQPDPYGMGDFVPVGSIITDLPGAYDPESGYMLPTGPDGRPPMEVGTFGPGDGLAPAADETDFVDAFDPFQGGVAVGAAPAGGFNPVPTGIMPQDDIGGFNPVMPVMDFAPIDFSSQMMGDPSIAPIDFSSQMMGDPLMDFAPVAPVMDFAPPPMDAAPPPMDFGLPPVAFTPPPMDFNLPPVNFTPPLNFAPSPAAASVASFAPPETFNFDFLGGMKRGGLTG